MIDYQDYAYSLPPDQQAIRDKCCHPAGTFVEFPLEDVETSIPARFEKIVRRYSGHPAIETDDRVVTYAQLNRIASRIAAVVVAQEGDRDLPVALLIDKGIAQIAAMLGVLKAGRFFILLDPSLPRSRHEIILEDCAPDALLTDRRNFSLAEDLLRGNRPVIELESIDDNPPLVNCQRHISADTIAFVVHTSGSSGRPKGVISDHRAVLHHSMLRGNADKFCPRDRVAHLTAGTGHAIIASISVLLSGATLLPFAVDKQGLGSLSGWLVRAKITILPIAVTTFRSFCEVLTEADRFPDIRLIRLSSSTVYKSDVDLYKRHFSAHSLLVNGLNSSEAHLIAEYVFDRDTSFIGEDVPVGYAARDKEILLLDDNGDPVGYHQVGELVVRSRYLTAGYWRNPELTAAKFRNDAEQTGKRIYYTGDLAVMRPDGCLIHKGRKDFRVKIRGYGVEFGEIERALLCHSELTEAAVVAWDREPGEKYLAAYVVTRPHSAPKTDKLREFLKERLPDYMIPSVFVCVASLPFANGKLDRAALPRPEGSRPAVSQPYVAPQGEVARELVRIWQEVLDVSPIGIDDNFFDLGGHSLAATRVIARLGKTFSANISLIDLFQTPTIAGLARRIAEMSPAQDLHANFAPIGQHRKIDNYPLSLAQQRLWFLHQLEPSSCAYNLLSALRLTGPLDVPALKQSFDKVVERHQVLRTIFIDRDGIARQVVLPSVPLDLPVVDLRRAPKDTPPQANVSALAKDFVQIPFELAKGPLFRLKLLRLGQDHYVLLLAIHHIVYDAWSIGILARDVSNFYNAIVRGETPAIQPLSIQYGDFALWQHDRFQASAFANDVAYWKKQLANLTDLQMPTDHPRPARQTHRGGKKSFVLHESLTAAIKKLSRNENVTLFMTLLAAFQSLLHRYSGQDDIVVGTAIDGRPQQDTEELIGFFLNTLVMRSQFSGTPTFRKLLGNVREICLEAFAHRELPFEKLVEVLQPERSLSQNPLFRVGFVLQNSPQSSWQLANVAAQKWQVSSGISQFDLHIFMEEDGPALRGTAIFNSDLFDADTIERMVGHFQVLLEGIVTNPDQRIGELPVLTPAEKRQLLVEWNKTTTEYPKDKCIHQLFEQQAEKSPDAIAVVFEDQQISYSELNARANQLAHYLQRFGVGPEILVGICLDRSIDMIVGLLAILKAGGAYVPLDPTYPEERLSYMLQDAQPRVLLTPKKLLASIDHGTAVCLDRDWHEIAKENVNSPQSNATTDNLAYVLYTSGSTGAPRGVAIEHRNTLAFISWARSAFTPEDFCGVLATTSICFDLSVFEVFATLACGGKIVLAQNALALAQMRTAGEVTLINTVPSAITELVKLGAIPPSVRVINLAGELLRHALVQQIYESSAIGQVNDLYGPTECTTYSTWTCRHPDGPQTIGRPIANTKIYVLDSHQKPVPIGIPGEIFIGGAGVARGYLNRPELTAEKFIANPFSSDPTSRLYKTGDLARYLPDGNIEFLGRIDNQVKIRGFRIELGEIESVLGQHPAVQQAVVLGREHTPDDRRLVAYIVASLGFTAVASELRSYLQQKLPEYMVPSAFMVLDALPLTTNGKLDRKALPVPDQTRPDLADTFAAPRNPAEEILASIWSEILKVDKVGIHDNFFHLGGHSLLATQVVSRIRDAFKLDLPLRALFEAPTIAALTQRLEILSVNIGIFQQTPIPRVAREEYKAKRSI